MYLVQRSKGQLALNILEMRMFYSQARLLVSPINMVETSQQASIEHPSLNLNAYVLHVPCRITEFAVLLSFRGLQRLKILLVCARRRHNTHRQLQGTTQPASVHAILCHNCRAFLQ